MSTPQRYAGARYVDVPERVREKFEKINKTRRGMYIHGPVGTGKTHVLWALNNATKEKLGKVHAFYNTTELMREIREDYGRDGYDKKHIEKKVLNYKGLLFLDDVGAEKLTDWVAETFYLIVNKRYNEMLPTIFSSNLPVGDLAEQLGDRTASRIVEMCDIIKLDGEDRRLKK